MTGREQQQSSRGNTNGRGRGRARPIRKENMDDITKLLGSFKLRPGTSERSGPREPSLDDIQDNTRPSVLQSLSDSNKELESTVKKCHKAKRFDIVPLTKLVNILQNTQKDIPELLPQIREEVICTDTNGPKNFYLQWSLQGKRLYLFGKWMYDMCERGKLKLINEAVKTNKIGIQTLVGRYVSVPHAPDPIRARGMITEVLERTAKVYLIDYGEEETFMMADIRVLPVELNQDDVIPFCFPARLTNIQPSSSTNRIQLDDSRVKTYFQNIVNDKQYKLYCTVENIVLTAGIESSFAFVSLSIQKKSIGPDGVSDEEENNEKDVVQLVQERMDQLEQQVIEQESRLKNVDLSKPTQEELGLLKRDDSVVNVRDYTDSLLRGISVFQIVKIINPSEFYLTLRLSSTLEKKKIAWEREMQAFYKDVTLSKSWKIQTKRVFKNRCYVWYEVEKLLFHRVRVLLTNSVEDEEVLVWLVDSAVERVVSMNDMMELNDRFSPWCALAFKAHLVDIEPFSKTESKVKWSQQSIALFKQLCPEQKFLNGVMIERKQYKKNRPSRGDFLSYGMILSDIRSESPSTDLLYSVQAQLVRNNVARPSGLAAGYHDLAHSDGSIPNYNRRLLEQELTSYLLPKENKPPPPLKPLEQSNARRGMRGGRRMRAISPLVTGKIAHQINTCTRRGDLIANLLQGKTDAEKAQEEMSMLQGNLDDFDVEQRVCRQGSDPNVVSTFQRETELLQDHNNFLPLKMRKNLGWIVINSPATVQGLSCFYIQMMSKFEEMCQMMDDLEKIVRPSPSLDKEMIEPGMFIAAQIIDEKSVPHWARIVVKSIIKPIDIVKGILLDFGQEVSMKVTATRELPPYFSTIPSYCQRVHLVDLFSSSSNNLSKELQELKPTHGKGWKDEQDQTFKRLLVGRYSPFNCAYYAFQNSLDRNVGVVELEAFNQPLIWDDEIETWVPGKVKNLPELDGINHRKNDNRLRQFFTSIGIQVIVEEPSEEDMPYEFVSLSNLLRSYS